MPLLPPLPPLPPLPSLPDTDWAVPPAPPTPPAPPLPGAALAAVAALAAGSGAPDGDQPGVAGSAVGVATGTTGRRPIHDATPCQGGAAPAARLPHRVAAIAGGTSIAAGNCRRPLSTHWIHSCRWHWRRAAGATVAADAAVSNWAAVAAGPPLPPFKPVPAEAPQHPVPPLPPVDRPHFYCPPVPVLPIRGARAGIMHRPVPGRR